MFTMSLYCCFKELLFFKIFVSPVVASYKTSLNPYVGVGILYKSMPPHHENSQ